MTVLISDHGELWHHEAFTLKTLREFSMLRNKMRWINRSWCICDPRSLMSICVFILSVNMPTRCVTNGHVQYFMINARLLFVLKCNFIFIAKLNAWMWIDKPEWSSKMIFFFFFESLTWKHYLHSYCKPFVIFVKFAIKHSKLQNSTNAWIWTYTQPIAYVLL